jgi:hypothetical protein
VTAGAWPPSGGASRPPERGELCKHDMPVAGCAWCSPPEPAATDWDALHEAASGDQGGMSRWIESGFGGTCPSCGERFEPGDRIRHDTAAGGWVCTECGSGD